MSNALTLTTSALQAPKDLRGVFELEALQQNCISNYEKTTGKKDGAIVYERERILIMKAVKDNPKLEQCTRPSIYFSVVELFASGLTLMDGLSYLIPYKDTCQFQIGWKGRLEQMSRMPEIRVVHEPQVVLTNELSDFEYQLGEEVRIIKHKPSKDRTITENNKIEFVYLVLDTAFGKRAFIMSRQEVLQIRDTYSIGYRNYVAKGGKWPDGNKMDPPFWITNEAEAFKKTIVKRAYKYVPKTPRQKILDEKIGTYIDHEDGTVDDKQSTIDYGLAVDQSGANVDSRQIASGATAEQVRQEPTQGAEPASQGGGKDDKPKRSHKKKEPAEAKVATTENGAKYDPQTGEEIANMSPGPIGPDGPGDDNPAADLPDLDNL